MGRMYTAQFTEVDVAASQDLFQIAANTSTVVLHSVNISQSSDVGDAAAENLSLRVVRVTDAVVDV